MIVELTYTELTSESLNFLLPSVLPARINVYGAKSLNGRNGEGVLVNLNGRGDKDVLANVNGWGIECARMKHGTLSS